MRGVLNCLCVNQVREEPVGSGRVVVLGRAHKDPEQDPEQDADEFGEWAAPRRGDVDVRSPCYF